VTTTTLSLDEGAIGLEPRMESLEDRIDALTAKVDIAADAIRGDLKLLLDRVESLGAEMRREIATVRKEHWSDHRVVASLVKDHGRRQEALERSIERLRGRLSRSGDDRGV
jgi:hypothetical protein